MKHGVYGFPVVKQLLQIGVEKKVPAIRGGNTKDPLVLFSEAEYSTVGEKRYTIHLSSSGEEVKIVSADQAVIHGNLEDSSLGRVLLVPGKSGIFDI